MTTNFSEPPGAMAVASTTTTLELTTGGGGVPDWQARPEHRTRTAFLVVLGLVGAAISAHLAAFQLGWIPAPWEPLFGDGSQRVLTSDLSRTLPVPDAVMGIGLYLLDVALGLILLARPRGMARVAVTLALVASAGALVGAVLAVYQVLVVNALCTLCLASAAVSWLLAAGAILEARARREATRPPAEPSSRSVPTAAAASSPAGWTANPRKENPRS